MIGLRALQHEEGRTFLVMARAARLAGAVDKDYQRGVRESETLLGLR